ncbi:MAG: Gfo/Idh/MocA family oxidoreductase [Pseudobutyrivibrio sp.]|nr:Gfo/Idh/MocA family oxidoreductase [Pseudobutyrivibrio sp.]
MKKVITYGTFDLFHEGHYNLLKHAKELGDYLIVGITTEQYDQTRGKLNVHDSLITRIDNVRASGFVDEVVVEDHVGQKIEDVKRFNVQVFTVGSDWTGKFDYMKEYCDVVYIPRTKNVSSTQKRIDANPIIRLGLIGTGRIAGRFPLECKAVSGINIVGAYNPHGDHAEQFADKHEFEFGTNNIEEFFENVDAVYIATPHETHYEYAKQALEHGKHVLCEKPMVLKEAHAVELYDLAKKNNLVLMEAIKTAYCPGFNQLITVAKSGIIGDVIDVEAAFSRIIDDRNSREFSNENYGGSFLEYGTYTLLPALKLLGKNYDDITFNCIKANNGVDIYTKAQLKYPRGMATSKTGVAVKTEGQMVVAGTKGYILAPSPWWLTKNFEVRYEDSTKIDSYSATFLGSGLRYEIAEFVKAIGGDGNKTFQFTRGESVAMAGVMERFLRDQRMNQNEV